MYKKPVFSQLMLAEVCLKGDRILEEAPLFLLDFVHYRDFELTVMRNRCLGLVDILQENEDSKKMRIISKKKGLEFGTLEQQKITMVKSSDLSEEAIDQKVCYLNTRMSQTKFKV